MNKLISKIILGFILVISTSYSNAQNQISDETLITLAKKKRDKIKPEDYVTFLNNFWDSTKDIFIKDMMKSYQGDRKEEIRQAHNAAFDYAHSSDPQETKRVLGDPNISREAWQAKFDKDWDPRKYAEDDFREAKTAFQGESKSYIIELIKTRGFSEVLKEDLGNWPKNDLRKPILQQQLKQWLDKY